MTGRPRPNLRNLPKPFPNFPTPFFKKDIYEAALFDKPNINATGSSYDEVIRKVYEKTLEYFDFLSDQGLDIPEPTEINSVTFKKRDKDVFFHVITIDTSIYAEKTE
ncbi:hypothetical protein ACFMJX_26830, partial [Acinetobacter baumannii]